MTLFFVLTPSDKVQYSPFSQRRLIFSLLVRYCFYNYLVLFIPFGKGISKPPFVPHARTLLMITNNSQWTAVISPTNSFASLSLGKRPKTLANWLLAKRPQFISVNHLNIFFKFPPAPDDCPPGELECPRKDVEQIAFNAQGQVCTITPSECLPANIWHFRYISNLFSRWTFTKQSGPFYHFKYDFSFHYNFMYLEEKSEWDTKPVPQKTFTTSHSNHPEIFRNVKPINLGQKSISFLYQLHFSFFRSLASWLF